MGDLALRLVDAAIALTLLEALLLATVPRLARRFPLRGVAANLLAGLALMAGLRLALAGAAWPWIAAALAAAGIAHAVDLAGRRA